MKTSRTDLISTGCFSIDPKYTGQESRIRYFSKSDS